MNCVPTNYQFSTSSLPLLRWWFSKPTFQFLKLSPRPLILLLGEVPYRLNVVSGNIALSSVADNAFEGNCAW